MSALGNITMQTFRLESRFMHLQMYAREAVFKQSLNRFLKFVGNILMIGLDLVNLVALFADFGLDFEKSQLK